MGERGRKPRITPEDVLNIFQEQSDSSEPRSATEIGDELNCARKTATRKLEELTDRGELRTKKVGARARVWWLPQTEPTSDPWRDGFGAFSSDTGFAEAVREEHEKMNESMEDRENDLSR